jgi:hypothetical protein
MVCEGMGFVGLVCQLSKVAVDVVGVATFGFQLNLDIPRSSLRGSPPLPGVLETEFYDTPQLAAGSFIGHVFDAEVRICTISGLRVHAVACGNDQEIPVATAR